MKVILTFLSSLMIVTWAFAQTTLIDTIAIQDFEVSPAAPTLGFTGPVIYNSGYSASNAAPPNSPIGIGGSRAWETTTNSSGLVLTFNNTLIPNYYDTVYAQFRLAAMNLNSSTGGPDDLDWVLIAYSLDGGTTFTNRIRIKGAVANNSFWPYSATGVARQYYLPATEVTFQPTVSGLQTSEGYSLVEIVFPGNIGQLQLKITARSSSSSDTWLIDNVLIRGRKSCINTTAIQNHAACESYLWPVNGITYTASGTYIDTIPNINGCDSIITLNLTIKNNTYATQNRTACSSYTWHLSGYTYYSSGTYTHTLSNAAGCDSMVTLNLSLATIDTTVTQTGITLTAIQSGASYQWLNCNSGMQPIPGAIFQSFTPGANGSYAVRVTVDSCFRVSSCKVINSVGLDGEIGSDELMVSPNPGSGIFRVQVPEQLISGEFSVYDPTGRTILSGTIQSSLLMLDLSGESAGIYILSSGHRRIKLLKE